MNWPQTLVKEIAHRRCVFFLGAGVSSSAVDNQGNRPQGWGQFLQLACALIRDEQTHQEILRLITERRFLLALQAIKGEADGSDYQEFLEQHFNNPNFRASRLHEIILELDSRLVITTNFDKIYENYCLSTSTEGFKVVSYSTEGLGDALRSDTRLIIKAHGTIDDIHNLVFTRSEYHNTKKKYSHFYEILKAIFLTSTVIFLGCGLDDPDVLLVLEDVKIVSSNNRPHYALVLKNTHNNYMINDWQQTYNIKVLQYEPDHLALITELEDLLEQVIQLRARNLN